MNHNKIEGRLLLGVGVILLSHLTTTLWGEAWRPKGHHYKTQESRQDCSVYQSVFTSTQDKLDRNVIDLKALTQSTQQYFKALSECRGQKGLNQISNEDSDQKTAVLCPELYDSWLTEGAHLITVEDEIEKLRDELSTLKGAVSRKSLPTMVADLK